MAKSNPVVGQGVVTMNNPEHFPAPLSDPRVLLIAHGDEPAQAWTKEDKLMLLAGAKPRTTFYVVWPGKGYTTTRVFKTQAQRVALAQWLKNN